MLASSADMKAPIKAGTRYRIVAFLRAREGAMASLVLVVAGLVEVAWAVGLESTAGFTRALPSVLTLGGGLLSFVSSG